MTLTDFDFLSDHTEETRTRFVTFIGPSLRRYDLAITTTASFYGKKLVTDLQAGKTAIVGPDDLEQEGYLEYAFNLTEDEGIELGQFLSMVVGTVNFSDL